MPGTTLSPARPAASSRLVGRGIPGWLLTVVALFVLGVRPAWSPVLLVVLFAVQVRKPLAVTTPVVLAGSFVTWVTLSFAWSQDASNSKVALQGVWACFVLYLSVYWGARSRSRLVSFLGAFVVAGLMVAIAYLAFAVGSFDETGYLLSNPFLLGLNPNYTAYVVATGFASLVGLAYLRLGRGFRAMNWIGAAAAGIAMLVCLVDTGSRGAQVSAGMALLAAGGALVAARLLNILLITSTVLAGLLSVLGLQSAIGIMLRFESLFPYDSGELGGRLVLWENAISLLRESPALGFGANGYWNLVGGVPAHNAFIGITLGTGLIGVALFICFVVSSTYSARLRDSSESPPLSGLPSILLAATLPIWLTGYWEWSPWAWGLLGLAAASVRLQGACHREELHLRSREPGARSYGLSS